MSPGDGTYQALPTRTPVIERIEALGCREDERVRAYATAAEADARADSTPTSTGVTLFSHR